MANIKEHAYELINQLPQAQLSAIVTLLEAMLDPVSRAVANAPIETDPLTPEEAQALDHARDWMKRNQAIPHEKVLVSLGISPEDIERFRESRA